MPEKAATVAIATKTFVFPSGEIAVDSIVREVPLDDGSIGMIQANGNKCVVNAGWLAVYIDGAVDWE